MNLAFVASVLAVALLQGALVALPRQDALLRLARFRSPTWALALPGLIVIGTFGLVLVPSGAMDLVVFATFATPVLAALAAISVVRRPLRFTAVFLTVAAGVGAVLCHGVLGQLSASVITASGAMLGGAVIVRLLPDRWLLAAIGAMCLIDVILMHFSAGQMSSQLLTDATRHLRGPDFDGADIGTIATEFPDLLLAAVIGAFVAGRPQQRRVAVLVTVCVVVYDLVLLYGRTIPATPPLCAAILMYDLHLRYVRSRGRPGNAAAGTGHGGVSLPPCEARSRVHAHTVAGSGSVSARVRSAAGARRMAPRTP